MDRDLEDDIRADAEIMEKIRKEDGIYAQHVYAALCNMRWQPQDTWSVLKDEYWTVSWRAAGGIVAGLRSEGDYLMWYCTGSSGIAEFVHEGVVTDEIRADFARIGWHPSEWPDD